MEAKRSLSSVKNVKANIDALPIERRIGSAAATKAIYMPGLQTLVNGIINTITPALAAALLRQTSDPWPQRSVSAHWVQGYARDMIAGNWAITGECLIFSKTGRLLNGQYRLRACVLAQVPFQTNVCLGIDDGALGTIDNATGCTYQDICKIDGLKHVHILAPVVTTIWGYEQGSLHTREFPTRSEQSETLDRYPELPSSVEMVALAGATPIGRRPKATLSLLHCFGKLVNSSLADSFVEQVITGFDMTSMSPTWMFREILLNNRRTPLCNRHRRYILATGIKALNAHLFGISTLADLRYRDSAIFPSVDHFPMYGYRKNVPLAVGPAS
jgi:hypothetical protein